MNSMVPAPAAFRSRTYWRGLKFWPRFSTQGGEKYTVCTRRRSVPDQLFDVSAPEPAAADWTLNITEIAIESFANLCARIVNTPYTACAWREHPLRCSGNGRPQQGTRYRCRR